MLGAWEALQCRDRAGGKSSFRKIWNLSVIYSEWAGGSKEKTLSCKDGWTQPVIQENLQRIYKIFKLRGESVNSHLHSWSYQHGCVAATLFTHRWCRSTDFPFHFRALWCMPSSGNAAALVGSHVRAWKGKIGEPRYKTLMWNALN